MSLLDWCFERCNICAKLIFNLTNILAVNIVSQFVAFQDFDSSISLDAVEAQLVDEIVEILVEDIFNATVANW